MMTEITEKIDYIAKHDFEGAERLKRLLGKKDALKEGNVYGERFTDRQFGLVFTPLLDSAWERARILEALGQGEGTVVTVSEQLGMAKETVFKHLKEMMRKNLVEMAGHSGRDPIYRKKA